MVFDDLKEYDPVMKKARKCMLIDSEHCSYLKRRGQERKKGKTGEQTLPGYYSATKRQKTALYSLNSAATTERMEKVQRLPLP